MLSIIKRKDAFDVESQRLSKEAFEFLSWKNDFSFHIFEVYEYENLAEEALSEVENQIFDHSKNEILHEIPSFNEGQAFRFHQVVGQYNEKESMVQEIIQKLLGFEEVNVSHSRIFSFEGVSSEDVQKFKDFYLNPVENVEISLETQPAKIKKSTTEELNPIDGFIDMSEEDIRVFSQNFSMDEEDMLVCHEYFKTEKRNPNLTELKVIDTYWSDHCRHTTFNTELDSIEIEEGPFKKLFKTALNDYFEKRKALNRTHRPMSLMDLGTIQAKDLMAKGILDNVEISAEINASALEIKVDVDGEEEDWILYFKNETHNHPTEIEPFGGASTCLGGGVRDPLSGRSWVYQAMRLSGGMNPNQKLEDVRPDKLPQRVISKQALAGYSDYANQIGVTSAFAEEVYHPGFEAKRLEVGALIAAAPRKNIVRKEPIAGDKIVLLGGRTGRDGLGGAVGSSQIQTEESLETAGAEVQKGAPSVERKIARLFRNGQATALIKRSNDFGAGGVSVAVGELADGLSIDLDAIPTKYENMHGGELALSESQERMAVVISENDLEQFLAYAAQEDVESAVIAEVTSDRQMTMKWRGKEIIRISRDFLDSNGAPKHAEALLQQPKTIYTNGFERKKDWSQADIIEYMTDINRASQQAMAEQFDASIGRGTVLYPYGGKHRKTQELGMISRLPVENGATQTTSGMAYGYHPDLAEQSPFHGGYYAVIESVARMVAMGFDYKDIRLTFQEYFESLKEDAARWGKPVLALLGANAAMDGLALGSIGGKDSMSGTFEELEVPPTLISFAVAPGKMDEVISRAFKKVGSSVVLIEQPLTEEGIIDLEKAKESFEMIHQLVQDGKVLAASTVGYNGLLKEMIEMSLGNHIGLHVSKNISNRLAEPMVGSILLEVSSEDILKGIDFIHVAETIQGKIFINDQVIDLNRVQEKSEEVFDSVFQNVKTSEKETAEIFETNFTPHLKVKQPKVLIPVLQGTNAEYDLRDAFQAEGFKVTQLVIKNLTHDDFKQSISSFISALNDHHVLVIAGGAIFGNQPDEIGRAWEIILTRQDVKEAIHQHLASKHLIFGSGTGLAPLMATGLIEHGKITKQTNLQLLPNKEDKFISDLVEAKVISGHSAWSRNLAGERYTTAVATAWGRIDLGSAKESLYKNGQVVSVFTHYFAEETIDSLTSPDGLVFGSLSNIERMDKGLYQNVNQVGVPQFIQQAKIYFQSDNESI